MIGGWPKFDTKTKLLMGLQRDNVTVIKDGESNILALFLPITKCVVDFNLAKTNFLNSATVLNEFEK